MPKPKSPDLLKYLPLGVMAVSLISGYTMLNARMAGAESKIDKMETIQASLSRDSAEIRVSQAKTEATTEQILDYIKDLRKK